MVFSKLFGDRAFYKRFLVLLIPIIIQNGITNLVNMLDNIMVGRVGTLQMTGVAVTNQLIFVFNLCIFGALAGAGIFGAQFFGSGDSKGVRYTFRFKMLFCILLCLLGIAIFLFCGNGLIGFYLKGEGGPQDAALSLKYAREYMLIMLVGLIPYTVTQCFSSTLRECNKTVLPMVAGVVSVLVNLILNYILIFGKFGAPKLGVNGAAVATVASRFAELAIVVIWTYKNKSQNEFIIGAFKRFYIPLNLIKSISIKGFPLMVNETLWAAGIAMLNQCYSMRGINVVAAINISQTFYNVFSVAFLSSGVSIGIILGQLLGAGKTEEARDTARKLTFFSILISVAIGITYIIAAEVIPTAYNTESQVRYLATIFMQITAIVMPIESFINAAYFTLRSGGKTGITFVFDSGFMWVVIVLTAFILSRFTEITIIPLFAIIQALSLIKAAVGFYFVKKGVWIVNLISK